MVVANAVSIKRFPKMPINHKQLETHAWQNVCLKTCRIFQLHFVSFHFQIYKLYIQNPLNSEISLHGCDAPGNNASILVKIDTTVNLCVHVTHVCAAVRDKK